jgi:ATP-dependent RNA helicase RhlE
MSRATRDRSARYECAAPCRLTDDCNLNSFHRFGLAEPITRALAEERYDAPTPIQAETIPLVLRRRDVVGIAQTGTGKTAAFALPILDHISANPRPLQCKTCRVLVLSPTRELSAQIAESFRIYGRYLRLHVALVIGGVPIGPQARALAKGVEILVATPGRLLDLAGTGAVSLDRAEVLVLDEADRMLDMGFIHDIRRIVAMLPKRRQNLFFSATMPPAIAELAREILHNPAKVAVAPAASTAEGVEQRIVHLQASAKPAALAEILRSEAVERALVFTRTKHGADRVTRTLVKSGIGAEAIHGNKSQNQRGRVLAAFRDGRLRVLVATDIAARGIDVDGITHVINYDLPNVPESYVHRIGRTARAGAAGEAISLCSAEELPHLRAIEKLIRMAIPADPLRARPAPAPQPRGKAESRKHRSRAPARPHTPRRDAPAADRHELATVPFLQPRHREQSGPSPSGPRKQWRRA